MLIMPNLHKTQCCRQSLSDIMAELLVTEPLFCQAAS